MPIFDGDTLYAGISNTDDSKPGSAVGRFFSALGRGIARAGEFAWDNRETLGQVAHSFLTTPASQGQFSPLEEDPYLKKHVFEYPKNIRLMDQLENGEPLPTSGIKQIIHISDMLKHRASTPDQHQAADDFRSHAFKAIIGNQLINTPQNNGQMQINGEWVDSAHAPQVIEANVHHLVNKEMPLPPRVIRDWPITPPPIDYPSIFRPDLQLMNHRSPYFPPSRGGYHFEEVPSNMRDAFKPLIPEKNIAEIYNRSRYPESEDLTPLSVRGLNGKTLLTLKEVATAFEKANAAYMHVYGIPIQVNSAYRSAAEQQILYERLDGKQAVAKPGHSTHNFGFGIDVQDYSRAKIFLEREGFKWSNHNNDPWHFDFVPN